MVRYPVRLVRIVRRFFPFLVVFLRDRRRFIVVGRSRTVTDEQRRERARAMRDTMLELGPTFIKVGQVLSTRPDIVPPVYAEVFSTLQDAVPPGPFDEIVPVLAEDVGTGTFDEFVEDPIAGGSLAQVHEARYRGERVAVKVQRPGIDDLIDTDLRAIRRLLPVVILLAPKRHRFSLRNLADDFERILQEELDFVREGRMMDEIRENFEGHDTVKIPARYPEVSTERVLTMEYVPSTKITDVDELRAEGFDPETVARDVANAYFEMGIEHGVFHGDPHPGNLGVDDRGRIVFYDFGMSGRFTPEMQDAIVDLYLAVVQRDVDDIMDVLIELGTLDPDVDRRAMAHVLNLVMEDLEGRAVTDWRKIIDEALSVLQEFPFRIPPDLMLVIRVGTVSEGVLRQLDPDFDFIEAARTFLKDHGYFQQSVRSLLTETRGDALDSARSTVRLPSKLERTLDTVNHGELEVNDIGITDPLVAMARVLSYALITAAWVVGSAILTSENPVFGAIGFTIATLMTAVFLWALHKARLERQS